MTHVGNHSVRACVMNILLLSLQGRHVLDTNARVKLAGCSLILNGNKCKLFVFLFALCDPNQRT